MNTTLWLQSRNVLSFKQKIFEIGDKPLKLLARILRHLQASQAVLAVKNKNGELINDPQEINKCFEDFYYELHSSYSLVSQTKTDKFLDDSILF